MKGISVIIPYYKGEKYIKETIETVNRALEISSMNYEIIIINDSPEEDISRYLILSSKLRIINNQLNEGIAYSRNKGKKLANYSHLHFIDQDDWIEENFYKKVYSYIQKSYDAIIFNYNLCEKNKLTTGYNLLFSQYIKILSPKQMFKYGNFFKTIGQLIVKKEAFSEFIETETMGSDDAYLFIDLFWNRKSKKIKYIKEPLFNYRVHENNYTEKTDFFKSSAECFHKYKKINKEVAKYEKYLLKRSSGDLYLIYMGRIIRLLTRHDYVSLYWRKLL
ncbi:glycosyltransferase family 2 protein [Chengkuizengella axinellae]|uniref:Glycosyltransferase family 2 protein n=1 Tax=Chengkuizengella axinellae TaxID=3064388 RepID=A0ABT9IZC4_9BACL|nr:glycosyltransferase family 2 protein [Chengkuizengella sp. 2205SS18-9]MDP5274721.1 glycosyltransferase family 2 protein [Chengkuizengella sp. 2205SS18-9]